MGEIRFSFVTGGTLALDAPSYVERQADKDLIDCLLAGETCYVLNSRQMGKSSLCVRAIEKLKSRGVRTAFLDLTKFGGRNLTAEQWYAALLSEVGRELGLRPEFLAHWKRSADLPPVQRLFGAVSELGLGEPLVIFIDEIDVTLSLPFSADEFFAAIRQCHVGRATDPRLKSLTFCLLGTASPGDLIQETRVSPFNIGRRIELKDFSEPEALPLAEGLGSKALLRRVLHWTMGHPYLTQRLCRAVQESGGSDVDSVCEGLFFSQSARDGDDNLAFVRNRLLRGEGDIASLLTFYGRIRSGARVADDETNPLCDLLKLSGLVKNVDGSLVLRCRIYERVFDGRWIQTHMPDAELRRQKEAYRRGVWRTAAVSMAALLVVASLAVFGWTSARAAQAAEKRATAISEENARNLYFSKMANLQLYESAGDASQMARILEETERSPYRGWEWGYWNAQVHDTDEEYVIDHLNRDRNQEAMFSQDGSQILIRDRRLELAILVDRKTRRKIGQYSVRNDEIVYQAGSRWLVAQTRRKILTVVDLQTKKEQFRIDSTNLPVQTCIPIHRAGLLGLSASTLSFDGKKASARIIDGRTGEVILKLARYGSFLTVVGAECRRQRFLLYVSTVGNEGDWTEAVVYDSTSRADLWSHRLENGLDTAELDPLGRFVAWTSGLSLSVKDINLGSLLWTVNTSKYGQVQRCVFNKSGEILICQHSDGVVVIRSMKNGSVISEHRNLKRFTYNLECQDLLADGESTRVLSRNLWSKSSERSNRYPGGVQMIYRDHLGRIGLVLPSNRTLMLRDPDLVQVDQIVNEDSRYVTEDGRLEVFRTESNGGEVWAIKEHLKGQILLRSPLLWERVVAPRSGTFFFTVSPDRHRVSRYEFGSTGPTWARTFDEPMDYNVSASDEGDRLLLSSARHVVVLDGANGTTMALLMGSVVAPGFIDRSTKYVIINEGATRLMDAMTLKQIGTLDDTDCTCVDLSPDESRILTGDQFGYVTLWDAVGGHKIARLKVGANFCAGALFTLDGKRIIVAEYGGKAIVFSSDETSHVTRIPVD